MIHTYKDTNIIPDKSETHAHFEVTKYIRQAEKYCPKLKNYFGYSNPGKLNIQRANLLQMTGFSKGFPDIIILSRIFINEGIIDSKNPSSISWNYSGLAIELKIGKNKPSKEQIDWLERLSEQGFYSAVCYGSDSAINLIQKLYL